MEAESSKFLKSLDEQLKELSPEQRQRTIDALRRLLPHIMSIVGPTPLPNTASATSTIATCPHCKNQVTIQLS